MMFRKLSIVVAALVLGLTAGGALYAVGEGRVQGTVVDENGNPLAGVKVTITSDEKAIDLKRTTKKNGRFSVILLDATLSYNFTFEKEGYRPVKEIFSPNIGGITRKQFTVPSLGSMPQGQAAGTIGAVAPQRGNPAIEIFNDGVRAYQIGDLETAKAKFIEASESDPTMPQPYSAISGLLYDQKDYAAAAAAAEKLIALEPDNVRALTVRYDSYKAMGDEEKSGAALQDLSKYDQGGDTAIRIYNEGAEATKLGDLARAKDRFQRAIESDPELVPAYTALGGILAAEKDYAGAAELGKKAETLDPENSAVYKLLYQAYFGLGDEEQAGVAFDRLAALDPQGLSRTLFDNGVKQFNEGQIEAARSTFEQVLRISGDYGKAHYMLGLCYASAGDSAKAREHLQRFVEVAPDDPDAATAREMMQHLG